MQNGSLFLSIIATQRPDTAMATPSAPEQNGILRHLAGRFPAKRIARVMLYFIGLIIASYVASAGFFIGLAGWDQFQNVGALRSDAFSLGPFIAIIAALPALLAMAIDNAMQRKSVLLFPFSGAVLGLLFAAPSLSIGLGLILAISGAISALIFWLIAVRTANHLF
ncbi:hypothetical protein HB779_15770 [Phyllobacterium sp. 628]|uniref:hypothetical protein n=1 Tax=Phyllobacterium sp. 628 TaxID=2718938 RepID=UPI0016623624|nr:hypothetical protein [Phyllobacterium sp. 628]QND53191.1 hypothetical protein HB779_15770 [Phyllobacterium sp. 628]